jgi:hypothetical protein
VIARRQEGPHRIEVRPFLLWLNEFNEFNKLPASGQERQKMKNIGGSG